MSREIIIVLFQRKYIKDWRYPINSAEIASLAAELDDDFKSAGVRVRFSGEEETSVEVRGYSDILNAIRLRSSDPGNGTPCLGHIIGESKNCNLLEDIKRGVSRLAFAPETIMPEEAHRKVCHNCGCGC